MFASLGSIYFAQILCAGKFSVKHLLLTSSHGRCGDCLELQFSIVRRSTSTTKNHAKVQIVTIKQEIRAYFAKFCKQGRKTRAKNMTPEQRQEAARKVVQARWAQ